MRRKIALLGLIAACNCHEAYAEAINEEVVVHRSLFSLGDVNQSATATYSYTGHSSGKKKSSSQSLSEGYGIATQLAVLDPDVLLLDLGLGVGYQQRLGNSQASLLDWNYHIFGSAFKLSYHPMQLSSVRSSSTVSTGYTPSYTIDRTFNKFSASLLHKDLPVYLRLTNSTVTTHGLSHDNTTDTNSGTLNTIHNGSWFVSDASLDFATSRSGSNESRAYTVSQNNGFDLDSQKRYRIATRASVSESVTETSAESVPQRTAILSCLFNGQLGKALAGSLGDDYSYSSTRGFEGQTQKVQTNTVSAGLSHSLYQSLNTSVSTSYGKTYALGGGQTVFNGTANIAYRKRLPEQSQLSLRGTLGKSVTRQDFADTLLVARDEPHTVQQQGDEITPALGGRLVEVTSVKSVILVGTVEVETPWVAETDYHVNTDTGKIVVLRVVDPNTTVKISYQVAVNRNLDFTTAMQNYQTLLSLLGGRYNLTASYATNTQRRISGDASNDALSSSRAVTLSGEAHYQSNTLSIEYGSLSSTSEDTSHITGAWTYDTFFGTGDHLRFSARDTYSMHAASVGRRSYDQNVLSASAMYSRSIFQRFRVAFSGNFSDSRTGDVATEVLALRTSVDGNFNSLTLTLTAGTRYYFAAGNTTQDTDVTFGISRSF